VTSIDPLERFSAGVLSNIGIPHWLPVDPAGWLIAEFGTEAIHIEHVHDASAGDVFLMSAHLQLAEAAEEETAAELCTELEKALTEAAVSDAPMQISPGMRCDDGRYESILLRTWIGAEDCENSPEGRQFLSKLMLCFLAARSFLAREAIAESPLFDRSCHASAREWSRHAAWPADRQLVSPDGAWLSIDDLDAPRLAEVLAHAGMDVDVDPGGFVRIKEGPFCVTVRANKSSGRLTIQNATLGDPRRIRGAREARRTAAALIATDTIPCRIHGAELDGNDQGAVLYLSMSIGCVDGISTTMLVHWTRWILGCRFRLHALNPLDAFDYYDFTGI
jgi:hypothetical protein